MSYRDKFDKEYPSEVAHLPKEEFHALLIEDTVMESSGYDDGDSRRKVWRIQVFPDRRAWELEIKKLESEKGMYRKQFKAVKINPAKITTTIVVE